MTADWKPHLLRLGLVWAILILVFREDAADMVALWWGVSTYNHCLLILPVSAWLLWQRREELAPIAPQPWPQALLAVFGSGLVWMGGEAAGIAILRHAGLVMLLQAATLSLLGPVVGRGVAFPLFYLVFLIPFGDELVPALQTLTARLTMGFLWLAGVPATLDGVFITTPGGHFEVAEACSGVKFLVAMIAYGALVANVCFRRWQRRAAFMAVSILVPVIANGLRAYATIHISEISGSTRFAESFDHVVFGWVFFALVIATVMALGWRFFDRTPLDRWIAGGEAQDTALAVSPRWPMAAIVLAVALLPVGWQAMMARLGRIDAPYGIALPAVAGWNRTEIRQQQSWRPRFEGADHTLFGQYNDGRGRRVDVAVALYSWQDEGRELVGYGQGALDSVNGWSWSHAVPAPPGGAAMSLRAGGLVREAVTFYRMGDMTTGSPGMIKAKTLRARLGGGDSGAVALIVSAENGAGFEGREAIGAFLKAFGDPALFADRTLRQARTGR